MDLGIKGNTAIITGGSSGIGLATAQLLLAEGCNVVLWDISPRVTEVAAELAQQHGLSARGQHVDITDFASMQHAFTELGGTTIHHAIHCAAMGSGKFGFPFTNLQPSDWPRTIEVNILGMVNFAHTLTPHFVANNHGSFVFLASVAGQIGSQTDPPYSASKAANINFAQCMAKDVAKSNVRVNTVCPGMVQTPLNRSVWQAWHDGAPQSERLSYEDWAALKIKNIVPLGRWQSVDDIASMIVFLTSARANQITGQTMNVDGGFVMHW